VFTITDKAVEMAKNFMVEEGKEGWGLRIFKAGEGCCGPALGLDIQENPAEGDEVIDNNGLKVFIDKDCGESLSDMQMDYVEDGERAGFILNGGDAPSCGSSGSGCSSCG
jgi:iron-sulfur cluster assembly accessory protein